MASNLFYPDNRKIADRVAEIIDSIVSMQSDLAALDDDMQTLENDIITKTREFAAKDEIITMDDTKKAVAKLVPPEFMKQIEALLIKRGSATEKSYSAIEATLNAASAIGAVDTGMSVVQFIKLGISIDLTRDAISALRLMVTPGHFAEGLRNLRALPDITKSIISATEAEQQGSTFLAVMKWTERVAVAVEIIGVALESVLVILAAVEGKEQRAHLLDNLNNLFPRRIMMKMVLLQAQIPLAWVSNLSSILTIKKYAPGQDAVIATLQNQVLQKIADQKKQLTFESVYKTLKSVDDSRGSYQAYDPSLAAAQTYADKIVQSTQGAPSPAPLVVGFPLANSKFFPSAQAAVGSQTQGLLSIGQPSNALFSGVDFGHLIPIVHPPSVPVPSLDIFWPDNPKRKARAQELYDDCKWISAQLYDIKAKMKKLAATVKPNLDIALKKMGLESFSSLEAKILEKCSSQDVQKWKEAKAKMDQNDHTEGVVFGIINICAAVVGVVGLGVLLVNPPIGGAIIAVAGAIDIASAIIQGLVDVFEGAEIRDQCRKAIHNLLPARRDARLAYEKMSIMTEWFSTVDDVMRAFEKSMTADQAGALFAKLHILSDSMVVKFQSFGLGQVQTILDQIDSSRNSWTKEDS